MERLMLSILAGMGILFGMAGTSHAVTRDLNLSDVTRPLVPTGNPRGDREFGGNGPRITIRITLGRSRSGRAIIADVRMTAVELGGDRSTAVGRFRRTVWRSSPRQPWRITRLFPPRSTSITHVSRRGRDPMRAQPGGKSLGTLRMEDGGYVVRVRPRGGSFVEYIDLLGDTSGDDISTDSNGHGDTSIKYIKFGTIRADIVADR